VTTGLAGKDNDKETRPFKSVYYLDTPSSFEKKDLVGCAAIFNNPPAKEFDGLELYGNGNNSLVDQASSQMTCLKVVTVENPDGGENDLEIWHQVSNAAGFLQVCWCS
jgi:hypothetical protein